MANHQSRKDMIKERIDNATSMTDLLPMLQFMELQTMKNVMKSQIETYTTSNDIAKIFHSSLSIEKILPMDIIQHISSFNNLSNIKAVSQTFNKCHHKNQSIQSKERQMQFLSEIQTNQENQTWIVDAKRTTLNQKEIALKYKGPIHSVSSAINAAKSGDSILICNGKYALPCTENESDQFEIHKNLEIIGCGDNVVIQCIKLNVASNVCFKNINFRLEDLTESCIGMRQESKLLMENCTVLFATVNGIFVHKNCVFSAINCDFYGSRFKSCNDEAIHVTEGAKEVNIIGCTFRRFGTRPYAYDTGGDGTTYPCIWIDSTIDLNSLAIKCIDNTFKDNKYFPIGVQREETDTLDYMPHLKRGIFQHNSVEYHGLAMAALDEMEYFLVSKRLEFY